jgi:hypothetical protein
MTPERDVELMRRAAELLFYGRRNYGGYVSA